MFEVLADFPYWAPLLALRSAVVFVGFDFILGVGLGRLPKATILSTVVRMHLRESSEARGPPSQRKARPRSEELNQALNSIYLMNGLTASAVRLTTADAQIVNRLAYAIIIPRL